MLDRMSIVPTDALEESPDPPKGKKNKGGRPRTTAARVEEIKTSLLQGVSQHYLRKYAQVTWGVSPSQARRYIQFAKKLIEIEGKPYIQDVFLEHIAGRRDLRRRANKAGDLKLELEIWKDEASLLNLYEQKKKPPETQSSNEPKPPNSIEEVLLSPEANEMVAKPADNPKS